VDKPWKKSTQKGEDRMLENAFTVDQRDALQEVANLAMGQAATRLARLFDTFIQPETQLLLDAIARRGRTEREKNPTILLASHHRARRITARLFAGFQIGFSCAAHIVARPIRLGQQGRLQRRSLFLALLRSASLS
jgi:hypothetical protein